MESTLIWENNGNVLTWSKRKNDKETLSTKDKKEREMEMDINYRTTLTLGLSAHPFSSTANS